jgi:hypothetical protein
MLLHDNTILAAFAASTAGLNNFSTKVVGREWVAIRIATRMLVWIAFQSCHSAFVALVRSESEINHCTSKSCQLHIISIGIGIGMGLKRPFVRLRQVMVPTGRGFTYSPLLGAVPIPVSKK